jgi:hypothetical protein
MVQKSDIENMIKKYQPAVKKTGEQLAKAVKSAEEDIARMYKIAQSHVEIQMTNLQKEKVYHQIGKDVAARLMSGEINIPELEKYRKKIAGLDAEAAKKKKTISAVSRTKKKK